MTSKSGAALAGAFWLLTSCAAIKKAHTPVAAEPRTVAPAPMATLPAPELAISAKYAERLAVPESAVKNTQLYSFVDEWLGTPYRYGGMEKTGTDCSGFTTMLYKQVFAATLPRSSAAMAQAASRVEKTELKEGDLVFFKINGRTISHVGVYLQNGRFVHASTKLGVIISTLDEEYYARTFSHGGRVTQP